MSTKIPVPSLENISTQPGSINNVDTVIQIHDISECQICLSEYNSSEMISTCTKQHHFCKSCLIQYLENCINDYKVKNIKCPQDGCIETLSLSFLKEHLDQKSFQIYQTKLLNKYTNKNSHIKICPKPGCSRGYKPQQNSNFTLCKCGAKICNNCSNFFHNGKTCLEALDLDFEAFSQENGIKYCIMCKSLVTRVEGCTHITCPVCDYEWCWICGREYSPFHDSTCPRVWMPQPPKGLNQRDYPNSKMGPIRKILNILFLIWLVFEMLLIFLIVLLSGVTCLLYLVILDFERFKNALNRHVGTRVRKRWETRNAELFQYTEAARPQGENQNNNNEVRVNPRNQNNDNMEPPSEEQVPVLVI